MDKNKDYNFSIKVQKVYQDGCIHSKHLIISIIKSKLENNITYLLNEINWQYE